MNDHCYDLQTLYILQRGLTYTTEVVGLYTIANSSLQICIHCESCVHQGNQFLHRLCGIKLRRLFILFTLPLALVMS